MAVLERVAADEAAERHTLDEFVQLEQATGAAKAAAASQPSHEDMDSLTAALADAQAELGDREQQISSLQAQLGRAKQQVQEKEQLLQQGALNIQAAEAEVAVIHGSNLQMFRYVSANIPIAGRLCAVQMNAMACILSTSSIVAEHVAGHAAAADLMLSLLQVKYIAARLNRAAAEGDSELGRLSKELQQ